MADFLNNLISRGNGELPDIGVRPLSRFESLVPDENAMPQDEEKKLDSIEDKTITPKIQQKNQTQPPGIQTERTKERTTIETIVETVSPITEDLIVPEVGTLESTPQTNIPAKNKQSTHQTNAPERNEQSIKATITHNPSLIEETAMTPQASPAPRQETNNSEHHDIHIQTAHPIKQPLAKETVAEITPNNQPKKLNESVTETLEQSTITPDDITVVNPLQDHIQTPSKISTNEPIQTETLPNSEPTINVTIGRIEVRATRPEKPNYQPAPKLKAPVMSLSEYLKKRTQGDT